MATPQANGVRRRAAPAPEGSDKQRSIEKKKCVTHEFRASFPNLFEAKSFNGGEAKFSVVMLFDKGIDLSKPANNQAVSLKHAAFNAAQEKWGPKEKWPKNLRMPFRDGDIDKPDTEGYVNTIFIYASSKKRPGIVDRNLKPILSEDEVYAGCYARAEVIAFAYDTAGNRGVSFSLQNIQKLKDGDSFSGRKDASLVFEAFEDLSLNNDGSESPENYSADIAELGI